MNNIHRQTFTVVIETRKKDWCGNEVPPMTAGDLRRAIESSVPQAESVSVEETDCNEKALLYKMM